MGNMKSTLKGIRNIFNKAGMTGKVFRLIRKNYLRNRTLTKLMPSPELHGHIISSGHQLRRL